MAALMAPSALEFGSLDLDIADFKEMTAEEFEQLLDDWHMESPLAPPDRSPGKDSSNQNSSLSPENAAALIYTPTSTSLDFREDATIERPEDEYSTSPDSNISPSTDDYVHVSRFTSESRDVPMMIRPPPGTSPGAISAQQSRASSSAASSGVQHQQWSSSSNSRPMEGHHPGHTSTNVPGSYEFDTSAFNVADDLNTDLLAGVGLLHDGLAVPSHDTLPFRLFDDGSQLPQLAFSQSATGTEAFGAAYTQTAQLQWTGFSEPAPQQPLSTAMQTVSALATLPTQQMRQLQTQFTAGQVNMMQAQQAQQARQHQALQHQPRQQQSLRVPQSMPTLARRAPYPMPAAARNLTAQQLRYSQPAIVPVAVTAGPSHQSALPRLAPTDTSSRAVVLKSQPDRGQRGGRKKHTHLSEGTRQKSSKMRKVGACWRCALQRDPCDDGNPCGRCLMRSQKGQQYFFDCDRSKLPDFVHDFLPPQASMTLMHQKQTIEDCVTEQVIEWDFANPVDVYLTSGYGFPLVWRLHEFKPKTAELLGQFQYLQNVDTRTSTRFFRYSPPFGITKLETSDETHFKGYVEDLMADEYLMDFGWTCFEEETQIDDFQARLLDQICWLYLHATDYDLRDTLAEIIRMMIITYIMGHTLTIAEETLPSVLGRVRHSQRPSQIQKHTSPRLANRQLKFFFAIMRNNIYEKILKWQQSTLHTGGSKEGTWLPSFCVMLGFAMVLEEVQRTIQIQADAKAMKGEKSHEEATQEAYNACERIDERFKLLVGLFQCKYRDRKWGANGSFGNQTPVFQKWEEVQFLSSVRSLVMEKTYHLESRKDVTFAPENQCHYTSRLVARFLLPFMKLPA